MVHIKWIHKHWKTLKNGVAEIIAHVFLHKLIAHATVTKRVDCRHFRQLNDSLTDILSYQVFFHEPEVLVL